MKKSDNVHRDITELLISFPISVVHLFFIFFFFFFQTIVWRYENDMKMVVWANTFYYVFWLNEIKLLKILLSFVRYQFFLQVKRDILHGR